MKPQQQVGTADIGGGVAAARIWPVDYDGLCRLAQDIHRVKIAVAQTSTVGPDVEPAQQGRFSRFVA
jgi:hypothetical protein